TAVYDVYHSTSYKMKVICAGLPKTATTSLAKALQVLGYNVYDFQEHYSFHRQQWLDSFETDRLPNFKEIYDGVDAITDVPPAFWFEEISATFPDSKVILTVRDSEEAWLKSWQGDVQVRILQLWTPFYVKILSSIVPSLRKDKHFFATLYQATLGSANPEATALFRVKYRQHNERVQAVIPAEKLLVFNVKQGWQPLCEFLGYEVPLTPFPRLNVANSDTKRRIFRVFKTEASAFFV
ncbi:hypothetical protein OS493_033906, partial [Desmophyllum pertusum]